MALVIRAWVSWQKQGGRLELPPPRRCFLSRPLGLSITDTVTLVVSCGRSWTRTLIYGLRHTRLNLMTMTISCCLPCSIQQQDRGADYMWTLPHMTQTNQQLMILIYIVSWFEIHNVCFIITKPAQGLVLRPLHAPKSLKGLKTSTT